MGAINSTGIKGAEDILVLPPFRPSLPSRPPMSTDTQIIERLVRVEEKLDAFLSTTTSTSVRLDSHDSRIRSLETSGARMLGMGAVIAAITGIGGAHFLDLFTG
jgi:hypothetical protein